MRLIDETYYQTRQLGWKEHPRTFSPTPSMIKSISPLPGYFSFAANWSPVCVCIPVLTGLVAYELPDGK